MMTTMTSSAAKELKFHTDNLIIYWAAKSICIKSVKRHACVRSGSEVPLCILIDWLNGLKNVSDVKFFSNCG